MLINVRNKYYFINNKKIVIYFIKWHKVYDYATDAIFFLLHVFKNTMKLTTNN